MSLGILFPGQGTQHPDMLPWLDHVSSGALTPLVEAFGPDWRARLADLEWTRQNNVAQPLITGLCLAAWHAVAPLLPAPTVVMGYSVGELASFCAAGVLRADDAMALAARRAALMDASTHGTATALISLVDAPRSLVDRLCHSHGLAVAIRFGPDRVIVGGERRSLDAAAREAALFGATVSALGIAIASHTPWMRAAVAPFAAALEEVRFSSPRIALVTNHDAQVVWSVGALKIALAQQLASPIRWDDCMVAVAERGVTCVLEVGPGSTLSRLWNAHCPAVPARSVDEFREPESVGRWVAAALA
jgi:[acyl-carrier-protein] S-malonyltransferase